MNAVKFSGQIINEPQLVRLDSGPILSFALQVDPDSPERMIIRVDVEGDEAERLALTIGNGDAVSMEGRLRFAKWTNKRGEQHQTYLAVADWVEGD